MNSVARQDEIQRRHPHPDARREPPHAIEQPGASIGTRRDPSWRRGVHEGVNLALRAIAEGWTAEQLHDWAERVGAWRFDEDAGELPPAPKGAQ